MSSLIPLFKCVAYQSWVTKAQNSSTEENVKIIIVRFYFHKENTQCSELPGSLMTCFWRNCQFLLPKQKTRGSWGDSIDKIKKPSEQWDSKRKNNNDFFKLFSLWIKFDYQFHYFPECIVVNSYFLTLGKLHYYNFF